MLYTKAPALLRSLSSRASLSGIFAPHLRAFSVTKHWSKKEWYGVEYYGGVRATEHNTQAPDLPRPPFDPRPYSMGYRQYPGLASILGSEYYFRAGDHAPLNYFHMKTASDDTVWVGSTDRRVREARSISNSVREQTTGFAVQILLEGRGVKAYFEDRFPNLKCRLGVGAKVMDLTEYCKRDPDVKVFVNKLGTIVVVHGPTKSRAGMIATRLYFKMKANVYTGKGAHIAFNTPRKKAVRKK